MIYDDESRLLGLLDRRMPRSPGIAIDFIHDPDRPWRERQAFLFNANRALDWRCKLNSASNYWSNWMDMLSACRGSAARGWIRNAHILDSVKPRDLCIGLFLF